MSHGRELCVANGCRSGAECDVLREALGSSAVRAVADLRRVQAERHDQSRPLVAEDGRAADERQARRVGSLLRGCGCGRDLGGMEGQGYPDPGRAAGSGFRPYLRRPRSRWPSPPGHEAGAAMKKGTIDWGVAQPGESPGYLLWRISAAWQRRIRAALKPHKITHAQFVLLTCLVWLLDHGEEAVTQVALADQAGLDKVTTGDVLETLEKANLVNRRP